MSPKKFTAFISYAHSDGELFAQEVQEKINTDPRGKEITFWQDYGQMKYGQWSKQIEAAIDGVEFLVLIITPGALASPNCKDEWIYARKRGVPVLPVNGKPGDPGFYEIFPDWLKKHHIYHPDKNWERFINALNSPPEVMRVPFMAPGLREITNYVARPGKLKRLKEMLLNTRVNAVSNITALQGSGGFGKTSLAIALCNDDAIINGFDDGILWVTLGQQKDTALNALQKLYDAVSADTKNFIDTEQAQQHLKEKLHAKKCLVVLDDVWHRNDAEQIIKALDQSTLLITTRIDKLLVTATQSAVDEMTVEESVQTLAGLSGIAHFPLKELEVLARKLGNWPLLLKLAAAQLHARVAEGETGEQALAYVNRKLQKKGLTGLDLNDAEKRDDSVKICLEASIDKFDAAQKKQLFSLGIFPEDENIPFSVIEKLWGLDDFDTGELLQLFHRYDLLDIDLPRKTVRMHDILLKYYHDKLANNYPLTQQQFIDQLGPYTSWTEKDTYNWIWYAWHIRESNGEPGAFNFLTEYAWIAGKLHASGNMYEVAKDYSFVPANEDMQMIYKTLLLSAHVANADPAQLPQQLYGRLATLEMPGCKMLALDAEKAIKKTICGIRPIVPLLEIPDLKNIVFKGHTGLVTGALLSGDRLISWSGDETLRSWDIASGQEMQTFQGHTDRVSGALLSGDRLISWSEDKTLRSWDIASGQEMQTFQGHTDRVSGALLLGDRLISWSRDSTLRSWDIAGGREMQTFQGHTDMVTGALLSGDQLISWSRDSTLRSWDIAGGREMQTFQGHTDMVTGALLSGDQLISWSRDSTLWSWDIASGKEKQAFKGHIDSVTGALLSGNQLISWSEDSTLRSWDMVSGQEMRVFQGHTDLVTGALLSGDQLISWSWDSTLRSWDIASGKEKQAFKGHTDSVTGALLSGEQLISWSGDGTLRSWDIASGKEKQAFKGHTFNVSGALLSGDQLISWSWDSTLRSWDIAGGKEMQAFKGHTDWVSGALLSGNQLISWSGDSTLRSWDMVSGKEKQAFKGHIFSVTGALLSGERLISWSWDSELQSWDMASGKKTQAFKGHTDLVSGALLSGDQLISWSNDGTLRSWDITSGREKQVFKGHTDRVSGALLSGERLISWSYDRTLRSWHLADGQEMQAFQGHTDRVFGALLSFDELISWSYDRTLRSWDIASGQEKQAFQGHTDLVSGALLSGDQLISWSGDRTLRSWDIASGQEKQAFQGHTGGISGALLSRDQLISWSHDGTLRNWDVKTGKESGKIKKVTLNNVLVNKELLILVDNLNVGIYKLVSLEIICNYSIDVGITALQVIPEHNRIVLGDASGRVHFLEPIGFEI